MNVEKVAKTYCVGCGLCQSECAGSLKKNEKGFRIFDGEMDSIQKKFVEEVCPAVGNVPLTNATCDVWGSRVGEYSTYAKDSNLRKEASSGGTVSALALYLIEEKLVDGVIQIGEGSESPYGTDTYISRFEEDIVKNCGSRYCISSPWVNLKEKVDSSKRYAAIGKPCDIAALRNAKDKLGLYPNIVYLISFFCAGMPSDDANNKLLSELGCGDDCIKLRYRGNGWPGFTTAVDSEGSEYKMEYSKSWGTILGRDVHPFCRICMDGIGLAADIACGDGWYIKNNMPDFSEREGRNITFTRTQIGDELLKAAAKAEYISISEWENLSDLEIIQKYQYTRRATMGAKIFAYKLMGKVVPVYSGKEIRQLSKHIGVKDRIKIFLGMIKRILEHKI